MKDRNDSNKRLVQEQFLKREYNLSHLSMEEEFAFYNAVKDGDLPKVKKIMLPLENQQLGHLSDNKIRNLKYHLIITIALITRFCIEGGMYPEDAYSLSDIYIQKLDTMKFEENINQLHEDVIMDYTKKMKQVRTKSGYSICTKKTMDYIYDHLHEKIYLDDLAEFLNMNKTYICKNFKSETGITIGEYICKRKIEASQNMLKYSDYSYIDISTYLGFSSHSHFISCFKKLCGMTPREYREKAFRNEFTL